MTNMKNKTYPTEITDEIMEIANALKSIFTTTNSNIRTIAKFSSMSVNSVKSVLAGKTANIASYSLIAKALGTNLIDVVHGLRSKQLAKSSAPIPTP